VRAITPWSWARPHVEVRGLTEDLANATVLTVDEVERLPERAPGVVAQTTQLDPPRRLIVSHLRGRFRIGRFASRTRVPADEATPDGHRVAHNATS
jgi:hypothetical protein